MYRVENTGEKIVVPPAQSDYWYLIERPAEAPFHLGDLRIGMRHLGYAAKLTSASEPHHGGRIWHRVHIDIGRSKSWVDRAVDSYLNSLALVARIDNSLATTEQCLDALAYQMMARPVIERLRDNYGAEHHRLVRLLQRPDVFGEEAREKEARRAHLLDVLLRLDRTLEDWYDRYT